MTAGSIKKTSRWSLTVNVSKTKEIASGDGWSAADIAPLHMGLESIGEISFLMT